MQSLLRRAGATAGRHFSVLHIVPARFAAEDGIMGGAERYAAELARYMADEVPTRLLAFGAGEYETTAGNLVVRVLGPPWYVRGQPSNPLARGLLRELKTADVVHCHQRRVLASTLAAMFCRLTHRSVYVTDLGGGGWDLSSYIATDDWYDGHLHLSEFSRRIYQHQHRASARVILGGVDTGKFSPAAAARRRTVLYAGRLLPHKGVDVLIRAMPPEVELQVIGHVVDEHYLTDLHRLAAERRVRFRHDCDDTALVEAYRSAACVVLPSVYQTMYGAQTAVPELLGQTLLEAMACGAPTVCTNVGSLPEVVLHGVSGFVVPERDHEALGERIRWLLAHLPEGAAMGAAGRRRIVENFTWPAVVKRCLEAYRMPSASGTGFSL